MNKDGVAWLRALGAGQNSSVDGEKPVKVAVSVMGKEDSASPVGVGVAGLRGWFCEDYRVTRRRTRVDSRPELCHASPENSYSLLIAVAGSRRAARMAGSMLAAIPTTTRTRLETSKADREMER